MSRTTKDTPKFREEHHFIGISSGWKHLRRKSEKAKIKQAIKRGEDPPRFKHSDLWEYF